jgi:outer membrane lipase/esterase
MLHLRHLVAAVAICASGIANASSIYFFGDSLSDTGNISLIAPGNPNVTPQTPYRPGQYTDNLNQVWSAQYAGLVGQSNAARPSLIGGNNYAIAGARTYSLPTAPIGVDSQLASFRADLIKRNTTVTQADLFVIMIGGNDLAQFVTGGSQVGVATVLTNLSGQISSLYAQNNARQFIVANMPNFGATPFFQNLNIPVEQRNVVLANAEAARNAYNAGFNQMIAGLSGQLSGISLNVLDFTKLDKLNLATYGITNTKDTCFNYGPNAAAVVGNKCASYAYSDDFHPTSVVHSIIAQEALALVNVPVPASVFLLGFGLLGLISTRRTRQLA